MPAETSLRLKLSKKLKLNIGNSEKNTGKIVKGQSSTSPKDDKFHKGLNRVKGVRNLKSSAESEHMKPARFCQKKKLAAKHEKDEDREDGSGGNREPRNGRSFARGKKQSRSSSQSGKDGDKSPSSILTVGGKGGTTSKATNSSRKVKNVGEKAQSATHKLKTSTKGVGEMDDSGNGLLDKRTGKKSGAKKQSNQSQNEPEVVSYGKSAKRKTTENRSLDGDSEMKEVRRAKKKPKIRIDPYDISNKRLDDNIAIAENVKKERKEAEKSVEMSKNAQFRAIKPSQSILSFVEDNLLGRRRMIELRRAGYNTDLSAPLDNIPFSTSSERERIEENIFRNKLSFFAAANVSSSFPTPECPEIAFAGRSNVGKSSMLNALTRQWGVARTSDKPGMTQTINFFKLGSKLCLVDLPGYGFAYAKEEVKDAWEELVKEYVTTRVGLKQVCVLIDTKWGMKPRDHELIDLMERSQTKYQIVFTKTDLVFPIDVARRAMQIEESLKSNKSIVQPVMMVSSNSGAGIRSLRTALAKIARFAKI